MRLIDADDLAAKIVIDAPDYLGSGSSITKTYILAMVKTPSATPTIDAIQVVRCKDCKWYKDDNHCTFCNRCGREEWPDENWYCAGGERKARWLS